MTHALHRYQCIDGLTLKLFALVSMTIDHFAAALLLYSDPLYYPLRIVGRLAFPIYCFLIVEGYLHTHNVRAYASRLLLLAVVSELPFDLVAGRTFPDLYHQNVFFTLFIGLVLVAILDHLEHWAKSLTQSIPLQKAFQVLIALLVVALAVAAGALHTDYGTGGILLILLFYRCRTKPLALVLTVTVLLYGFFGTLEAFGALSLIPILLYNGQRGKQPFGKAGQWFFYFYYPLHLGLFALLNMTIFHTYLYQILGTAF